MMAGDWRRFDAVDTCETTSHDAAAPTQIGDPFLAVHSRIEPLRHQDRQPDHIDGLGRIGADVPAARFQETLVKTIGVVARTRLDQGEALLGARGLEAGVEAIVEGTRRKKRSSGA